MPPAIAAVAITVAATSVGGVIVGAVIGAVIGAGIALASGEDVGKGALSGAMTGAGAVIIGGLSVGTGTASVGEAGAETVGTGQLAVDLETGATSAVPTGGVSVGQATGGAAVSSPSLATGATGNGQGILSKATNWMEHHPRVTDILGQTVSGAAEAMLKEGEDKRTIEALMERDRLNREANKIGGLTDVNTRSVLPSISGFLDRPKWEMNLGEPSFGILNQERKKA